MSDSKIDSPTTIDPSILFEEEDGEEFEMEEDEHICHCTEHCNDTKNTCKTNGYCFAMVDEVPGDKSDLEYEITYGCMSANDISLMQCRSNGAPHRQPKMIHCCNNGSLCNLAIQPQTPRPFYTTTSPLLSYTESISPPILTNNSTWTVNPLVAFSLLFFCSLASLIVFVFLLRWRRRLSRIHRSDANWKQNVQLQLPSSVWLNLTSSASNKNRPDRSILSTKFLSFGKRSMLRTNASHCPCGLQRVNQRATISRQIQLLQPISIGGRYGQLYLGKRKGTDVAVRLLLNDNVRDWMIEKRIHQMPLLRHDNLIGFVAADCVQMIDQRLHLLITDYHPFGSLQDLLKDRLIDERIALRLMHSAARGLHHLHVAIRNRQGKPQIAHLDIRSRNIMVKADFTCVISNFRFSIDSENISQLLINATINYNQKTKASAKANDSIKKTKKKTSKECAVTSIKNDSTFETKEFRVQMPNLASNKEIRVQVMSQALVNLNADEHAYEELDSLKTERKLESGGEGSTERSDETSGSTAKVKIDLETTSGNSHSDSSDLTSKTDTSFKVYGCSRYAAPELLIDRFQIDSSIDSYKRADVYSFALVIWEISRRCSSGGYCEQYQQPYFEYVGDDRHPSAIQMKHVVVTKGLRPSLNTRWFKNERVQEAIAPIVESMWNANPQARLSMLKVKKELGELTAIV